MTVASTVNSVSYLGNGVTVNFTAPFYFLENGHLRVTLRAADGTETLQVITTNYTVTGAGNPAGGQVTMLAAPASGQTLVIRRAVPATQEVDYVTNDAFPAETHERALDKLTMLAQGFAEADARALRLRETDVDGDGAFDGRSNRITNLDEGVEGSDAVTLGQMQSFVNDVALFGVAGVPREFDFVGDGATVNFDCPGIDVADPAAYLVAIDGILQNPGAAYTVDLTNERIVAAAAPPLNADVNVRVLGFERPISPSLPGTAATFYRGDGLLANTLLTPAGAGIAAPAGGSPMHTIQDATNAIYRTVTGNAGLGGTAYSFAGSGRTYDMAVLYSPASEALQIQSDTLGVLQVRHSFYRDGRVVFGSVGLLEINPVGNTIAINASAGATITGNLPASLITSGIIDPSRLGSGIRDGTKFLRDDGVWATGGGGGGWSDEQSQDAVAAILIDSATIHPVYNDAAPSLEFQIIPASIVASHIADGEITTAKIDLGAVTSDCLAASINISSNFTVNGSVLTVDATADRVTVNLAAAETLGGINPSLSIGPLSNDSVIMLRPATTANFARIAVFDVATDAAMARIDLYNNSMAFTSGDGINRFRWNAGAAQFSSGDFDVWKNHSDYLLFAVDHATEVTTIRNANIQNVPRLIGVAADPGAPVNGDFWYNTVAGLFKFRQGGATVTLGGGGAYSAETAQDDVCGIFIASATITPSYVDASNQCSWSVNAGSIGTGQLANLGVTTAKIADANVTTAKIADANVTTAKIANFAITDPLLAVGSVIASKIAANAVDVDKINATGRAALRSLRINAANTGLEWVVGSGGGGGLTNVYDVKASYGAQGDGITDDTAAINAAFAAAAAGGIVYFPLGTYRITSTITVNAAVSILGIGSYKSMLKWDGAVGGTMIQVATVGKFSGFNWHGVGFDCNGVANIGIKLGTVTEATFSHLYVKNFRSRGMQLLPTIAGNLQACTFQNITLDCAADVSPTVGAVALWIDGITTWNVCHNVFSNIITVHCGYGLDLRDADNNTFLQFYCFRRPETITGRDVLLANSSGSGSYARANYFFHLQGEVEAQGNTSNSIDGYDRENGQAAPVVTGAAALRWTEYAGASLVGETFGETYVRAAGAPAPGTWRVAFSTGTGDIRFTSPAAGTRNLASL